jgi:hypothetical protein
MISVSRSYWRLIAAVKFAICLKIAPTQAPWYFVRERESERAGYSCQSSAFQYVEFRINQHGLCTLEVPSLGLESDTGCMRLAVIFILNNDVAQI